MVSQILAGFDVVPDISLQRQGSSLLDFSNGCRQHIDATMTSRKWFMAIAQDETESVLLGALEGFYYKVSVAHVEAACAPQTLPGLFQTKAEDNLTAECSVRYVYRV